MPINPTHPPIADGPDPTSDGSAELARLQALSATGLLETGGAEDLAELPAVAAAMLGAPMAAISLLDDRRQVLVGPVGFDGTCETPRGIAFCQHTIAGEGLFEVVDARADPRFRDNPLVLGGPRIGSYAGVPVTTADGQRIGALFVADHAPRALEATQREQLQRLARHASRVVALRTAATRLGRTGRAQDAAVAALRRAADADQLAVAFSELLADLLEISGSAYGFIGEVHEGRGGRPFLKTHAMTNIAWNDETRELYERTAASGMEFHRLDTLLGHVMATGQPLYADDPARDPRRGGLPPGHPPLDAYVGLPVHSHGHMVGMVGLANRPGGYSPGLARDLEPVLAAIAALVEAARAERQRRAAEAALARERAATLESERRFRAALESLEQVAVQAYTPDGRITFWNRASEALYGWRASDVLGSDLVQLMFPPEARDAERALLAAVARSGEMPAAGEVELARRDGSRAIVYATRVLVPRADGPPEFFCFDVDVTQRRQAEAELALSEARLRLLNESAPHAILVLDADTGRFADFNGKACQLFGVDAETLRRLGPLHFSPERQPDGRPSLEIQQDYARRTIAGEEPVFEWMHQRADGTPVPCEIHLARVPDPHRVLIRGNVIDITERKAAERALRETEARLALVVEHMSDGFFTLDREFRYIDINEAAARYVGRTAGELRGRRFGEIVPENLDTPFGRAYRDVMQGGPERTVVDYYPPLDRWFEAYVQPVGMGIAVFFRDITDRKRAELALRESERRFRSLVEDIATIAVQGYDQERRITFWNRASERLYGWTAQEAIGRRLEDTIIPPAMREAVVEVHGRWLREGGVDVPSEELVLADRGGMPVPVYSSHVMQRTPEGALEMYCLDIDLRDLRRTEAALQDANALLRQRNEEMQRFVMIASHDLQEPLRKMQAFADRLQGSMQDRLTTAERDYLERLHGAAARMRALIQDLLDYSSVSFAEPRREAVDLAAVLREVLEDLATPIAASGARVESQGLPTLAADPMQMRQLLQNLVGNALKYRHPQRPPRVRVDGSVAGPPGSRRLVLCVADNGIGFDDAHRERIFAPFQRLHARTEYDGTGIGLAIVRRIAERHGGTVEARGRPGEGADFTVVLPVIEPPGDDPAQR